jgi:hypothetical protein
MTDAVVTAVVLPPRGVDSRGVCGVDEECSSYGCAVSPVIPEPGWFLCQFAASWDHL